MYLMHLSFWDFWEDVCSAIRTWADSENILRLRPCHQPPQYIIFFWFLDVGAYLIFLMHGNCRYGDFENSMFWDREVQTIFWIGQFGEIWALGLQLASRRGLLLAKNSISHFFWHVLIWIQRFSFIWGSRTWGGSPRILCPLEVEGKRRLCGVYSNKYNSLR